MSLWFCQRQRNSAIEIRTIFALMSLTIASDARLQQGRSLRNHRVVENGRSVVRNACKMPNLTAAQRVACNQRRMVARSDKLKQRLPQRTPVQAPPPGPFTGYIVFAQWDGRTYPNVVCVCECSYFCSVSDVSVGRSVGRSVVLVFF